MEARLRRALPFVLVGRDAGSGVYLKSPEISRRHAFLQMVGGRLQVLDLQSRTGVVWEEPAGAEGGGLLEVGQAVRIGPYRLSWLEGRAISGPSQETVEATPTEWVLDHEPHTYPEAAFVMPIRIGDEDSIWRIEADLTLIGRSGACRLVLSDDSVSRFHAALVRTPLGVWIVDLGAREGVVVSGVRVRWAWLDDGDTVRLGRFTFVFRYLTPPGRICRDDVPFAAGAVDDSIGEGFRDFADSDTSRPGQALALRSKERPRSLVRVGPTVVTTSLVAQASPRSEAVLEPMNAGGGIPLEMWQRQMQMMESFHNDMLLMVQAFFAMHREQLASVRDEITRVETLTAELDTLTRKLTGEVSTEHEQEKQRSAQSKLQPSQAASPPSRETQNQTAEVPDRQARAEVGQSKSDALSSPRGVSRPEEPQTVSPELHQVITQRIATLQRERQGYWQRILSHINP